MNSRGTDSCKELFKNLEISHLYSQYIFSLLLFVVKNKDQIKRCVALKPDIALLSHAHIKFRNTSKGRFSVISHLVLKACLMR